MTCPHDNIGANKLKPGWICEACGEPFVEASKLDKADASLKNITRQFGELQEELVARQSRLHAAEMAIRWMHRYHAASGEALGWIEQAGIVLAEKDLAPVAETSPPIHTNVDSRERAVENQKAHHVCHDREAQTVHGWWVCRCIETIKYADTPEQAAKIHAAKAAAVEKP